MARHIASGIDALTSIVSMLGNIDHSAGVGENTARLYGGILNSIRGIAEMAMAFDPTSMEIGIDAEGRRVLVSRDDEGSWVCYDDNGETLPFSRPFGDPVDQDKVRHELDSAKTIPEVEAVVRRHSRFDAVVTVFRHED